MLTMLKKVIVKKKKNLKIKLDKEKDQDTLESTDSYLTRSIKYCQNKN